MSIICTTIGQVPEGGAHHEHNPPPGSQTGSSARLFSHAVKLPQVQERSVHDKRGGGIGSQELCAVQDAMLLWQFCLLVPSLSSRAFS